VSRRRRIAAAVASVLVLVAIATVALVAGGGDPAAPPPDRGPEARAAARYAATWTGVCRDLRTGAAAAARRLDRRSVLRWLASAERTLARIDAARPPRAWSTYHREAVRALAEARRRIVAARERLRGDAAADPAAALDLGGLRTPPAPDELRRRTPACGTPTAPGGAATRPTTAVPAPARTAP
jgi:hypothetical protein